MGHSEKHFIWQKKYAGVLGFEPRRRVLETLMLPLHHTPKDTGYCSRKVSAPGVDSRGAAASRGQLGSRKVSAVALLLEAEESWAVH